MKIQFSRKIAVRLAIAVAAILACAAVGFCVGFFFLPKSPVEAPLPPATELRTEPQTEKEELPTEPVKEKEILSKTPLMKGIDVSKWQGKPNWQKIAASGVEFAMIRIGFHGTSGSYGEDTSAAYNLAQADENGILTGVYFYSLAESAAEAKKEAAWVLERVGKYAVSLPIVIDYEMQDNDRSLTATQRTEIALAFLQTVTAAGYEGMIYVPIEEWEDESLWVKEAILENYKVWGADYAVPSYPEREHPDSASEFAMWQYSNTGRVDGIAGNVDLNLAYFTRERSEPKIIGELLSDEELSRLPEKEFQQTFTTANRFVTAKIEVNLRKTPSIEGELVASLKNGEYLLCTGDSDMGWSRLEYQGQRVFAVTTYLVDQSGQSLIPPQSYLAVNDTVTAKELVNLRIAPSTDSEIVGTLEKGTYLKRTGIGDKGWSKLEYNGQTVYAVTSYLTE